MTPIKPSQASARPPKTPLPVPFLQRQNRAISKYEGASLEQSSSESCQHSDVALEAEESQPSTITKSPIRDNVLVSDMKVFLKSLLEKIFESFSRGPGQYLPIKILERNVLNSNELRERQHLMVWDNDGNSMSFVSLLQEVFRRCQLDEISIHDFIHVFSGSIQDIRYDDLQTKDSNATSSIANKVVLDSSTENTCLVHVDGHTNSLHNDSPGSKSSAEDESKSDTEHMVVRPETSVNVESLRIYPTARSPIERKVRVKALVKTANDAMTDKPLGQVSAASTNDSNREQVAEANNIPTVGMMAEPPETQHTYTTGSSGGSQAETVDTHPRENSNPARSNRVRSRSIGSVGSTPITTEQRPELGRPGVTASSGSSAEQQIVESAEINNTIIENDSIQVLSLSSRAVARAGSGSSVSQSEIRSANETTIEDNDSNNGLDLRPSSGVFAGSQTERGAGGGGGTISTCESNT